MGDMGELYYEWNKNKSNHKVNNLQKNKYILLNSGFKFKNIDDHTYLFRDRNKPKADFYLNTNKWKSRNKLYYGNAENFINWYKNKSKEKQNG